MDKSCKADFIIRQFWQLLSFSKYLLVFDIAELSLLHCADTRRTERPFMPPPPPPPHTHTPTYFSIHCEIKSLSLLIDILGTLGHICHICHENCCSISGTGILSCSGYLSLDKHGSVPDPAAAAIGGLVQCVLLNHVKRRAEREREREILEGNDWLWV